MTRANLFPVKLEPLCKTNPKGPSKCFLFALLVTISPLLVHSTLICPPPKEIIPCTCTVHPTSNPNGLLSCRQNTTSQHDISNLFTKILLFNNRTANLEDTSNISKFYLFNSQMEILDLLPLTLFNFDSIILSSNSPPLRMVRPRVNSKFRTRELIIALPEVSSDFLQDLLHYVDPLTLQELALGHLQAESSEEQEKFMASLKPFKKLRTLRLDSNNLNHIGVGRFEDWEDVQNIILTHNNITQLEKDSFFVKVMENNLIEASERELRVNLDYNELTDEKIDVDCGLFSMQRPVRLELNYNNFKFLSEGKFKKFLDAHPRNSLSVVGNDLICEKIKWLVEAEGGYKGRVRGVKCRGCEINGGNCTKTG